MLVSTRGDSRGGTGRMSWRSRSDCTNKHDRRSCSWWPVMLGLRRRKWQSSFVVSEEVPEVNARARKRVKNQKGRPMEWEIQQGTHCRVHPPRRHLLQRRRARTCFVLAHTAAAPPPRPRQPPRRVPDRSSFPPTCCLRSGGIEHGRALRSLVQPLRHIHGCGIHPRLPQPPLRRRRASCSLIQRIHDRDSPAVSTTRNVPSSPSTVSAQPPKLSYLHPEAKILLHFPTSFSVAFSTDGA
ncbi:hypothetical protein BDZ97DRAFT_2061546 [Flammula alnicola]|nr:hypothetical protein BDZ97DRAFT_2061546 [Flammula alnicola]